MDALERAMDFVDAWTAPIVDRKIANEELVLIICQAEQAAREQALEEAAQFMTKQARILATSPLSDETVERIADKVAKFSDECATTIRALKAKGGTECL
ncbi:MAG: hypothetical protein ACR2RE_02510 [Geminicoccaceae bacterium]